MCRHLVADDRILPLWEAFKEICLARLPPGLARLNPTSAQNAARCINGSRLGLSWLRVEFASQTERPAETRQLNERSDNINVAIPRGQERTRAAIGLINNMGDEALKSTERQFGNLLSEAADDIEISFRVFAMRSTPRSSRALDYINARYEPVSAAMVGELDRLAHHSARSPRADAVLARSRIGSELVELIDWVEAQHCLHYTFT